MPRTHLLRYELQGTLGTLSLVCQGRGATLNAGAGSSSCLATGDKVAGPGQATPADLEILIRVDR